MEPPAKSAERSNDIFGSSVDPSAPLSGRGSEAPLLPFPLLPSKRAVGPRLRSNAHRPPEKAVVARRRALRRPSTFPPDAVPDQPEPARNRNLDSNTSCLAVGPSSSPALRTLSRSLLKAFPSPSKPRQQPRSQSRPISAVLLPQPIKQILPELIHSQADPFRSLKGRTSSPPPPPHSQRASNKAKRRLALPQRRRSLDDGSGASSSSGSTKTDRSSNSSSHHQRLQSRSSRLGTFHHHQPRTRALSFPHISAWAHSTRRPSELLHKTQPPPPQSQSQSQSTSPSPSPSPSSSDDTADAAAELQRQRGAVRAIDDDVSSAESGALDLLTAEEYLRQTAWDAVDEAALWAATEGERARLCADDDDDGSSSRRRRSWVEWDELFFGGRGRGRGHGGGGSGGGQKAEPWLGSGTSAAGWMENDGLAGPWDAAAAATAAMLEQEQEQEQEPGARGGGMAEWKSESESELGRERGRERDEDGGRAFHDGTARAGWARPDGGGWSAARRRRRRGLGAWGARRDGRYL